VPRKRDDAGRCLEAGLRLAAIGGWNNVTLHDIAAEAGLDVADVAAAVGSRHGVLKLLASRADQAMLQAVDEDWAEESRRERLFTLLMARFDFLKPHREGVRAILTALPGDPVAALSAASGPGMRSMTLALEASGVSAGGPVGRMRARALGVAYAVILRTFLDDDSDDLSRTMAAVDRQLNNLERLAGRVGRGGFGRKGRSGDEAE
jgi:AcrR family transcriptional regulator